MPVCAPPAIPAKLHLRRAGGDRHPVIAEVLVLEVAVVLRLEAGGLPCPAVEAHLEVRADAAEAQVGIGRRRRSKRDRWVRAVRIQAVGMDDGERAARADHHVVPVPRPWLASGTIFERVIGVMAELHPPVIPAQIWDCGIYPVKVVGRHAELHARPRYLQLESIAAARFRRQHAVVWGVGNPCNV